MFDFSIKVYRHDATTTHSGTFYRLIDVWTEKAKNVRFSTKNPGGFSECSFSIDTPYAEAFDIYESYHHNYITIESGGGDIIWQGRIYEITPEPNQVSILAYGMWSHAFDVIYDSSYFLQIPGAENSILNKTADVAFSSTYRRFAQSFQLDEARAIQDIQVRLANPSTLDEGFIVCELCADSSGVPGTVLASRSISATAIETSGFSEYAGLTTTSRLSASTTYWISLRCNVVDPLAVTVGIDENENYADGKLRYYNGSSWSDYPGGADMIFYVWTHQKFNYYSGTASTALDVIEDAVSACPLFDSRAIIARDTGTAVVNPITFSNGEKPGDVMERVAAFGSSDANPEQMFVGVYDANHAGTSGPVVHFRKFSQGRKWYIDISDLAFGQQGMSLSSSLDGMKTRTAVLYSDSVGSRTATPWVPNDYYDSKFGYNRDGLFSIAGASETVADLVSAVVADAYGRPQSKLSLLLEGYVRDMAMNRWPVWYVRAGDVLKIRNLFPTSSTLSDAVLDGISTIYIQETDFDATAGRMTITPSDMNRSLLDIVLVLAGLSGGSMV